MGSGGVAPVGKLPGVSGRVVELLYLVVALGHVLRELVHGDLVVVWEGAAETEAGAVLEVGGDGGLGDDRPAGRHDRFGHNAVPVPVPAGRVDNSVLKAHILRLWLYRLGG